MRNARVRLLPALCIASLLGGCASTFEAERVDLKGSVFGPGVYYPLPKTVFDVSVPAVLETTSGGELADFEQCVLLSRLKPSKGPCTVKPSGAKSEMRMAAAKVVARAEADEELVYRVSPDLQWWFTQKHTFTLNELGYLGAMTGSASNGVPEAALGVVAAVAKIAVGGPKAAAFAPSSSSATELHRFYVAPKDETPVCQIAVAITKQPRTAPFDIDLLVAAIEARLDPLGGYGVEWPGTDADCIVNVVKLYDQRVAMARETAKTVLQNIGGDSLRAGYAALLIEQGRLAVKQVEDERAAARLRLRVDAEVEKVSSALQIDAGLQPVRLEGSTGLGWRSERIEGATRSPCLTHLATPGSEGAAWCVLKASLFLAVPGEDGSNKAAALRDAFLRTHRLAVKVESSGLLAGTADTEEAKLKSKAVGEVLGYRYRLPARATIQVAAVPFDVKKVCEEDKNDQNAFCAWRPKKLLECETKNDLESCGSANAYNVKKRDACRADPASCSLLGIEQGADADDYLRDAGRYASTDRLLLASQQSFVAQLGPLVALPSTFRGVNAKLEFRLNNFGALETVTLGQDSRDGKAISGLVDTLGEARAARSESKAAAADAASAAPLKAAQNANALRSEQIKALALQRCLNLMSSLPAGVSLPDECKQ